MGSPTSTKWLSLSSSSLFRGRAMGAPFSKTGLTTLADICRWQILSFNFLEFFSFFSLTRLLDVWWLLTHTQCWWQLQCYRQFCHVCISGRVLSQERACCFTQMGTHWTQNSLKEKSKAMEFSGKDLYFFTVLKFPNPPMPVGESDWAISYHDDPDSI